MNPCEATSATRMALRSSSFVADMAEGNVVGSMSEIEERVPEAMRRCSLTRMVVSVSMSEGEGDAEAVVVDTAMKVLAEDRVGVKNWGEKRYTSAEFVSAPNQVRNVSASSHGPIVSVREGTGRRLCTVILNASERISKRLFTKAITRNRV
jgi:hypothetical protein